MLEIIDHGPIREIRLSRPPANALNTPLVTALTDALEKAADEADTVVISGLPGMFCAGLDVPELLDMDREAFIDNWRRFIGVQKAIATLPIPVVFAMTGHAPAGGIVLGVFGDYRIMPRGGFKTGLNEVQLGLVVPEPSFAALVQLIGGRAAENMVMDGLMLSAEEAVEIGLVDELVDSPEAVVPRAIEWCEQRISLPRDAMLMTRKMARRAMHDIFENYDDSRDTVFIDLWFSETTQAKLRRMVASMKNKA